MNGCNRNHFIYIFFVVFKRLFNIGNRKHFFRVSIQSYRNTCGNLEDRISQTSTFVPFLQLCYPDILILPECLAKTHCFCICFILQRLLAKQYVYTRGCLNVLENYFKDNLVLVGAVAIAFLLPEVSQLDNLVRSDFSCGFVWLHPVFQNIYRLYT